MKLTDLLRSTGFRLVMWYAAVFAVSVVLLFAVVYWIAIAAVEQQQDESVRREINLLTDIYQTRGPQALDRGIQRRTRELTSPRRYYLLLDERGRMVSGNLPAIERFAGPKLMAVPVPATDNDAKPGDGDKPERMLAHGRTLANGEFLLVGENRFRVVKTAEAITSAAGWGIAVTVLLGFAGGMLLALGYLRRIEEVNRTIRSIMDGDLSQRVQVHGSSDEMAQLSANLNAMLDRIQALMESLKRVSDDIAHDLRTPLSRLRQRLEAARGISEAPAPNAAIIEQSIQEVDAILDTFTALLRIAQIEAGTRRAAFAEINLASIVTAIGETYAPVAEDRGQRLELDVSDSVRVLGDRELLLQVLANLVENAIQHGGAMNRMRVELRADGDSALLRVTDSGPGIPAAERSKVFRRFYRLERNRTTPGSGLGLALVKAVCELHGAAIELSDHHPGLCVSIRFARLATREHELNAPSSRVPAQSAVS
jgi:signal transduction histidine kinase